MVGVSVSPEDPMGKVITRSLQAVISQSARTLLATLLLLTFLLTGCVSPHPATSGLPLKKDPNKAYVWIVLHSNTPWQRATGMGAVSVHLGDSEIGTLRVEERVLLALSPGTRSMTFYMNDTYPLMPFLKLSPDSAPD